MRKCVLANLSLPGHEFLLILSSVNWQGMTYEEVMVEYEITREDILATLDYAAKTLASEEIRAVN